MATLFSKVVLRKIRIDLHEKDTDLIEVVDALCKLELNSTTTPCLRFYELLVALKDSYVGSPRVMADIMWKSGACCQL